MPEVLKMWGPFFFSKKLLNQPTVTLEKSTFVDYPKLLTEDSIKSLFNKIIIITLNIVRIIFILWITGLTLRGGVS